MNAEGWRKARALFWVLFTLGFVLALLVLAGLLAIPGLPQPGVNLSAYRDWIFVILILLATKALLEVLKPVFHAALKSHVRYEADIFSHFKLVSYVVWGTALGLVLYIFLGASGQQNGLLSSVIVLAALTYVMQEPLLNFVGWMVLVSMRVYKLGDRIEIDSTRGYIVGISPMNTTVREFGVTAAGDVHTGRYVTIPNSKVIRGNVYNATKDTPFVWDQITITVGYKSDAKAAEALLLETAEETVAPVMRRNRDHLRSKYEFLDLQEYVSEEPMVLWGLRDVGIDLTLVYFCPVFERAQCRTDLVKRILEKVAESKRIQIAAPAVLTAVAPTVPVLR